MRKKDVIGKTIEEVINEHDIKVKLGADRGNSYIYCGELKDMNVDFLDKLIVKMYKARIHNASANISRLTNMDKSYEAFFEKHGTSENVPESAVQARYMLWLNGIEKTINTSKATRAITKEKLENFTTIKDRIITDVYKSIDEDNTLCLLYNGNESGSVWTTEEYNKMIEGENALV